MRRRRRAAELFSFSFIKRKKRNSWNKGKGFRRKRRYLVYQLCVCVFVCVVYKNVYYIVIYHGGGGEMERGGSKWGREEGTVFF